MLNSSDFLATRGCDIVNARGERVMLRGTNLGGWLLREGWMDGAGAYEQSVPSRVAAREGKNTLIDLGCARRVNRLRAEGIEGGFRIFAGPAPDALSLVGEGSTENVRRSLVCNGRPAAYVLGRNIYNEGCFFDGGQIHLDELRARWIKLECGGCRAVEVSCYADADDYTVRAVLTGRFGRERAKALLDAYQDAYISEPDLDELRGLGFNLLRAPIYWEQLMDSSGRMRDDAWARIDWLIEQCAARDMYVIPDLHGLPGGQSGGISACGRRDANDFWNSANCQLWALKMLGEMARRYRGVPAVAAYDLMNEPLPILLDEARESFYDGERFHLPAWIGQRISQMLDRMLGAVRAIDPEHIISICMFIDNFALGAPGEYGWDNVICQTHTYGYGDWRSEEAMLRAADAALKQHRQLQQRWKVPILSGESNFWESTRVLKRWLGGLNAMGISWATWTYKNTDPDPRNNWGVRYAFDGLYPDCERDSYEDILEKYASFTSDHYLRNDRLARALNDVASAR